jgi:hypothetical protein
VASLPPGRAGGRQWSASRKPLCQAAKEIQEQRHRASRTPGGADNGDTRDGTSRAEKKRCPQLSGGEGRGERDRYLYSSAQCAAVQAENVAFNERLLALIDVS